MATELQEAIRKLALWQAAEDKAASGAEYRIGNRTLRRQDLPEIRTQIAFYQREVARISASRGRGARVQRIVPRDL